MNELVVDFVARGHAPGEPWLMVLVESGPWDEREVESNLRRIQARMYDCVDAALEGRLADRFPDSRGQNVVVRLDGYDLPEAAVRDFFERFASAALQLPDYAAALESSTAVSSLAFDLQLDTTAPQRPA